MIYPIKDAHSVVLYFILVVLSVVTGFMWYTYPYASGLLHWHRGNHMILSASEVTLKHMGKIDLCQSTTKHNKM